jgi:quinol-cytochrome oxidoreductase complex cytochrome b subunit/cytochrome c551/c552
MPHEEPTSPVSGRFVPFGAGLLVLALVAVITGIALVPLYHATAEGAYQSVAAMQASAPLRWLRAVHHWASALLILLGAVYLVSGLFSGCYRRPLRLAWVAAVGLVVLFLLFQITGHLLPWDSQAVSTAAIESGIAANVPVVGPLQARLVRGGGDAVSARTLSAWYIAHVALLPVALAALGALFIHQVRRTRLRLAVPRVPVTVLLVILALGAMATPAPLGTAASPADYTSYTAQSEWYVLPMHALLVLVQTQIRPDLGFLGTVVIPGLAVLALLALPWLDRRVLGDPPSPLVRGLTGIGVVATLLLMATNLAHMEPIFHRERSTATSATPARRNVPNTPLDPALIRQGKAVFDQNGCIACHALGGKGAAVGPPLDGEGTRRPDLDWQIQHLKDPASVTKGSTMPPYKQLNEKDLRALATFLLSLK